MIYGLDRKEVQGRQTYSQVFAAAKTSTMVRRCIATALSHVRPVRRIIMNSIARGMPQDWFREFGAGKRQSAGLCVQAPRMVPSRRNRRRLIPLKNIESSGTSSMPPAISGTYAA